ncbi:hypothetical protein KM043_011975 [Ampulex compressa]|nr:hypothetical protein KM043_011975 [Ampulex compressa]
MPRTESFSDEDKLLLHPDERRKRFDRFPHQHAETAIVKGAVNQLARWPADVYVAFVAACFLIAGLALLVFVTAALSLPPNVDDSRVQAFALGDSPKVYFVKLENQSWSMEDFCYMEIAARRYPKLNVNLISLTRGKRNEDRFTKAAEGDIENTILREYKSIDATTSHSMLENYYKHRLSAKYPNVHGIALSVEEFFGEKEFFQFAQNLNDELLEVAVKIHLLWNSPGIILRPDMYCALEYMIHFICGENIENCVPDKLATIELKNDIQATGVPCQSFIGFVMREISKNRSKDRYTLSEALQEFCPRLHFCNEVRNLDLRISCSRAKVDCPTIYPSEEYGNSGLERFLRAT